DNGQSAAGLPVPVFNTSDTDRSGGNVYAVPAVVSAPVKNFARRQRCPAYVASGTIPTDIPRPPENITAGGRDPAQADTIDHSPAPVVIGSPPPALVGDPDVVVSIPDPAPAAIRGPIISDQHGRPPDPAVLGNSDPAAVRIELCRIALQLVRQIGLGSGSARPG